ncbi:hypothetical protein HDF10_001243 [Edaphobacter lichenicola]|uniref:Uncharacterized protein n=1 Tax=Tunturiibacter lichenicola TaxID=2051959 RepID=A0A7W8N3B5_9BACT|nr:hypothetical protein [Edaphobacter lichenicola]
MNDQPRWAHRFRVFLLLERSIISMNIVRFEKADAMMIGDFYRNYGYPFIDPQHGGTFKGCRMRWMS